MITVTTNPIINAFTEESIIYSSFHMLAGVGGFVKCVGYSVKQQGSSFKRNSGMSSSLPSGALTTEIAS